MKNVKDWERKEPHIRRDIEKAKAAKSAKLKTK